MVGRRLVILVAVLMGLMVLAASVAPPPPTPRESGAARTPVASPSAAARPSAPAPPGTVQAPGGTSPVLLLDVAHGRDHVTVHRGALFTLNVVARATGSVEIVGLSYVKAIDPSTPARFQVDAVRSGTFPVRLVEGGRPLGELIVSPGS